MASSNLCIFVLGMAALVAPQSIHYEESCSLMRAADFVTEDASMSRDVSLSTGMLPVRQDGKSNMESKSRFVNISLFQDRDAMQAAVANPAPYNGIALFQGQDVPAIMKYSVHAQLLSMVLWTVLIVLTAYYHREGAWRRATFPTADSGDVIETKGFSKWKFGLWSCFDEPRTACCSCLFPAIRWSLTLGYARILSFWTAFTLYMVFSLVVGVERIIKSSAWTWLLLAILSACYRQQLREKFGMEKQHALGLLQDSVTYAFCWCCAIVQEARHVEEAVRCNHPAVAGDGSPEMAH